MGFSGSIEQVKLNDVLGAKTSLTLQKYQDLIISSNTTLSSNLVVNGNITIDSTYTLTTNGYSIICSGTFTNNGTITTGNNGNIPTSYGGFNGYGGYGIYIQANQIIAGVINANGQNGGGSSVYTYSMGGGGGGVILLAYGSGGYTAGTYNVSGGSGVATDGSPTGSTYTGGNGGSTLVSGGLGSFNSADTSSGNGGTPSAPTLTNELISSMYSNGFINYLSGTQAGGGTPTASNGANALSFPNSYGGSGGGSGGYTSTSSTYYGSGAGGNGQILTYNYSVEPIADGLTSKCNVITTGKIQVVLEGIKLGSTLDSSILQINILNITTNNTYSFIVASGQTFYYSFIDSQNVLVGQNYQYQISVSVLSGTPSTALYYSVEAREVL